ncbi:hypothetical protein LCGC14_1309840 [marine sediment metagenome]|uniref:Uncharacterized protein n=1 Tax=marine sediment metagenome TaxID=412755 RepID=A0A0F9KN76_9ZZZZ
MSDRPMSPEEALTKKRPGYVVSLEDTEIRCPECKESMTLPGPIAELDFYQCHSCGYMIDLKAARV